MPLNCAHTPMIVKCHSCMYMLMMLSEHNHFPSQEFIQFKTSRLIHFLEVCVPELILNETRQDET